MPRSTNEGDQHGEPTSRRVLIAEDNPIVRADLRAILEDAGFDVCSEARDGVEVVDMARRHGPDVVVLDLRLPRMSGVDATWLIRGERTVPVVAITGYRVYAEQALEAGAVAYLLKPYSDRELIEVVERAFERSDLERSPAA